MRTSLDLSHEKAQDLLLGHFRQPTKKGKPGTELEGNNFKDAYADRARALDKLYGKPEDAFKKARDKLKSSYRPDGTKKGTGFLGVLQLPGGGEATEYSIGVGFDGKETLIPSLVPTLTAAERKLMIEKIIPDREDVPVAIRRKAVAHAKKRMKAGLPVFK